MEVFFPGVVGGHIFDVLAYSPGRLASGGPLVLLRFLHGNSSLGGFFSTLIAYFFYLRRRLPREKWVVAFDVLMEGIVVGQIFGRLSCTLVHDHPGRLTRFPLAFAYPGGARHDLGFYEFLLMGLVIFPTTLWIHRLKAKPGTQFAVVMLLYGVARFFLDFLRAVDLPGSDARYLGLTPAQYLSVVMFLTGAVCIRRLYGRAARAAPARPEIIRG